MLVSCFVIFFVLGIVNFFYLESYKKNVGNKINFRNYFFESEISSFDSNVGDEFLLKLIIPSIDFEMGIYDIESEYNEVNLNVELLASSQLDNNVFFFAGHSGRGENCYFNRVNELILGDIIFVKSKDKNLVYEVVKIYNIVKNGYMEVDKYLEDVLFLITCSDYNRQLVVKGVLIN